VFRVVRYLTEADDPDIARQLPIRSTPRWRRLTRSGLWRSSHRPAGHGPGSAQAMTGTADHPQFGAPATASARIRASDNGTSSSSTRGRSGPDAASDGTGLVGRSAVKPSAQATVSGGTPLSVSLRPGVRTRASRRHPEPSRRKWPRSEAGHSPDPLIPAARHRASAPPFRAHEPDSPARDEGRPVGHEGSEILEQPLSEKSPRRTDTRKQRPPHSGRTRRQPVGQGGRLSPVLSAASTPSGKPWHSTTTAARGRAP